MWDMAAAAKRFIIPLSTLFLANITGRNDFIPRESVGYIWEKAIVRRLVSHFTACKSRITGLIAAAPVDANWNQVRVADSPTTTTSLGKISGSG